MQVKNKPHEEVMSYAFILGPDSIVPNSDIFNPLVFYSQEPMRPPDSNPSFYLIQFQIFRDIIIKKMSCFLSDYAKQNVFVLLEHNVFVLGQLLI